MFDLHRPSQTALVTAAARAAHLLVDQQPWIFEDRLAAQLLGRQADRLLADHRQRPAHRLTAGLRVEVTCRARYTEQRLTDAVARGTDQVVVLGAGLDTFGYRSSVGPGRVYEVDRPSTQAWKRRCLADAGIDVPAGLTFVGVDFERQRLVDCLVAAGFDPARPAFVTWLGCTMYLSRKAVAGTVAAVAGLAAGSELVVDHLLPRDQLDRDGRAFADAAMPQVMMLGEPWRTWYTPDDLAAVLRRAGFGTVSSVLQPDMLDAALWQRTDALRPVGASAIAHATVGPPA